MKFLLLGMMTCLAAGAGVAVEWIPDGPLSTQQMFFFGLMAGTIGTIAGCAAFYVPDVRALARQGLFNMALACIASPWLCLRISEKPEFPLVAMMAGTLGCTGSVVLGYLWPMFVEALKKRAQREIQKALGVEEQDKGNGE